MITQSSLDERAKNLGQHENARRIKKLIYCACKSEWENDQNVIDRFSLTELIQELCSFYPTLEHLNYTLSEIVKTLNKPGEYSIVANVILQEIEQLYIIAEEATGIIFAQPEQEEATGIMFAQPQPQISSHAVEEFSHYQIKSEYNPFDLRQNIMKYTNPLRAKLVLFFAIENKAYFQEEDWLQLKNEELDGLLGKIFDISDTARELESRLNNAVISLGNNDDNIQAADAIIQSMQGLYSDVPATSNQYQSVNRYVSEETESLGNYHHQSRADEDNRDNTYQLITPPKKYDFRKKQ